MAHFQLIDTEVREDFYEPLRHMVLILGIDGKVNYINSKGADLLKYPKSGIIGKSWLKNFVPDEFRESILKRVERAVKEKTIVESYEHPVKCGDKKPRIIKWYNNLLFDAEGNVKEILKTGEEVTMQRENEKKLAESEENYRTLVENIYQVAYRIDFPDNIKEIYPNIIPSFASKRVKEFSGYSIEDFQNGSVVYLHRIHPDERNQAATLFFQMLETKKPVSRNYRFRHKNGEYKWIEDSIIPVLDKDGKVAGCFGVVYDVSDKIQQLQTIKEYEKFFSLSQDMFCIAGTDGYFKKINPSFERILGYSHEELLARPFIDFVHPDDVSKTMAELSHLSRGGITVNFENRYRCKDGNYKWLSWTSSPADTSSLVYAVARDITDQKAVNESLRKNEAFLNSVVENIPNMIFVKEAKELKFVRFNKAGEELIGYAREDMIGKNDFDFFPKKEADFFTSKDREVLKQKKLANIPQERIQTRNKGERILHTQKIPLYDQNGKPEYLLGISEDITEKKRAEELIKENQQKLIEAQEIAHVGSWEVDLKTEEITLSREACRLFGIEKEKKISREEFRKLIHPDDRESIAELVESSLENKKPFETELKVVWQDGSIHYLLARGRPIVKNDKVVKLMGTGLDITESKLAAIKIMKALVTGQDIERRRIADDLHDSLGQKLSAIKLTCENIHSKEKIDRSELKRLSGQLNEAIEEIRNISYNLIPATLNEFGLKSTLLDLCNRLDSTDDIKVSFQAYGVRDGIDKNIEFAVYRIVQELLTNAIKHSQASEIAVQLFERDNKLILTVEDDGVGFDKGEANFENSLGLNSITSRAKALNGMFEIDSQPGNGTLASVEIPLEA